MQAFLAIALVAAFALAGCLGASDTSSSTTSKAAGSSTSASSTRTSSTTAPPASTGSTTSAPPAGGTTTTSAPPAGKSHTATLTASVRNGTAPLNVTFLLAATNVDAQTKWTLALGDGASRNGTTLPVSVTHRYNSSGTKTAQATVLFGDGKTATSSLTIAVLPAAAGGSLLNKTFSYTIAAPNPAIGALCGAPQTDDSVCAPAQLAQLQEANANGTFFVWYDVAIPAGAASMLVEGGTQAAPPCVQAPACAPGNDFDIHLVAPDGSGVSIISEATWESGTVEAPAAGTWGVAVHYFAGSPNAAGTLHIVVQ